MAAALLVAEKVQLDIDLVDEREGPRMDEVGKKAPLDGRPARRLILRTGQINRSAARDRSSRVCAHHVKLEHHVVLRRHNCVQPYE